MKYKNLNNFRIKCLFLRYEAEFGMDPPPFSLVRKWHQHFLATGSVLPPANWNRNAGEEVLPLSAKVITITPTNITWTNLQRFFLLQGSIKWTYLLCERIANVGPARLINTNCFFQSMINYWLPMQTWMVSGRKNCLIHFYQSLAFPNVVVFKFFHIKKSSATLII